MNGLTSPPTKAVDAQLCDGTVVGTKATIGASTPATLRSTSSASVLPLIAMRLTPIATSAPTNTAWTGVK
jgi:hypothetical protein